MIKRVQMFGLGFQAASSLKEIVDDVLDRTGFEDQRIPLLITPNVDQVVKLERESNHDLKQALSRAQWILPDGQPIVTLSKMKYGEAGLKIRLTGSDFFPVLWKALLKRKCSVLFVLSNEALGLCLQQEKPDVRFYSPPFFNVDDVRIFTQIIDAIMIKIQEEPVDYLFIGLGFPKQERIALEIFRRLRHDQIGIPKTFLLGASFEFYCGLKKRAPVFWQKTGLEFVHRLFSEPRRMAKRYLIDDAAFILIALRELRKSEDKSLR